MYTNSPIPTQFAPMPFTGSSSFCFGQKRDGSQACRVWEDAINNYIYGLLIGKHKYIYNKYKYYYQN